MYFIGASGHAKVVIEAWQAAGGAVDGVFDDDPRVKKLLHFDVVQDSAPAQVEGSTVIISIGSNENRKKVAERFRGNFGMVIHPSVIKSPTAVVGKGSAVMAGAILNAATEIGAHVIVNTAATVDHDCRIADFVHIAPNAVICGGVTIGEGTLIGAGATIIQNISIGRWAVIGAGSVINNDVPDHAVVVGIPGKIIRLNA